MAILARNRPGRERVVAVLDIGTSKVICAIAAIDPACLGRHSPWQPLPARLLGHGHQRSRGIKAGAIVDLGEAEAAARAAIGAAEARAGLTVEEVVVAVSAGRVGSDNFKASAGLGGSVVRAADLERAFAAGRAYAERDGRRLLHLHRLGYGLDEQTGIRNPAGMAGDKLKVDLNAVTADEQALHNLNLLVERCFLSLGGLFATPYASALATLSEAEAQLGACAIDMGAGTTSYAVFTEGRFQHCGSIAVGGGHVTLDIARVLGTPVNEAERIKTLYGNLIETSADEHNLFEYPIAGETDGSTARASKARLGRIVRPRVEEALGLVRERLERCGLGRAPGTRMVVAGGASQMLGLAELAERIFSRPVRLASPRPLAGSGDVTGAPGFAAAIGLLQALAVPGLTAGGDVVGESRPRGYMGRVGLWLKESFWDDETRGTVGGAE